MRCGKVLRARGEGYAGFGQNGLNGLPVPGRANCNSVEDRFAAMRKSLFDKFEADVLRELEQHMREFRERDMIGRPLDAATGAYVAGLLADSHEVLCFLRGEKE